MLGSIPAYLKTLLPQQFSARSSALADYVRLNTILTVFQLLNWQPMLCFFMTPPPTYCLHKYKLAFLYCKEHNHSSQGLNLWIGSQMLYQMYRKGGQLAVSHRCITLKAY